ncbi:MAG: hypothetical protein R6X16_09050, partial [Anaerolineae bacterium]
MLALLRHILSAEYLYALQPLPPGVRSLEWVGWAGTLLVLSLAALLWHRQTRPHSQCLTPPCLMLFCVLAAWLVLAAQVFGSGPLSARVWTLSFAGMALSVPLWTWLARRRCPAGLKPIFRALACDVRPGHPALPLGATIAWLLGHALALGSALAASLGGNNAGQDPCAILLSLVAGVTALAVSACATRNGSHAGSSRHTPRVELLAPLLLPYLALRLQWFLAHTLGVDTGAYHAYAYPDLWSPWFDPGIPWLIAAAWMLTSTARYLVRARPGSERWLARLAGLAGLAWLVVVFVRHLSRGAGGSDPFAYLQMATDLATTGDLRHVYPLVSLATEAGVTLWPLVPVGYHPPLSGVAATVWPPGWPVLLAPLYRLGGEPLVMWGAPLCLLLSAWLTFRLARMLWGRSASKMPRDVSLVAGLAVALLLTSYETLTRALVPMADAAATACMLLMLLALIHARRTDDLRRSAAAGLTLALAYSVRHPLLPLALAAAPALLACPWSLRRRLTHGAIFAGVALAGALPDLRYHVVAFGSPWTSESAEWFLLSPANIPGSLAALWQGDLLRRNEFGYLWPLVAVGLGAALCNRTERDDTLILLTGAVAVLLFHLSYEALRLRDLLPLFPVVAHWATRGTCAAWAWGQEGPHPLARRAGVTLALLLLLAARSTDTLALPLQERVQT